MKITNFFYLKWFKSAEEEGKEYDEMEEDDKDKFSYQLLSIGSFGRLVPEYSLPLLTMLV